MFLSVVKSLFIIILGKNYSIIFITPKLHQLSYPIKHRKESPQNSNSYPTLFQIIRFSPLILVPSDRVICA